LGLKIGHPITSYMGRIVLHLKLSPEDASHREGVVLDGRTRRRALPVSKNYLVNAAKTLSLRNQEELWGSHILNFGENELLRHLQRLLDKQRCKPELWK